MGVSEAQSGDRVFQDYNRKKKFGGTWTGGGREASGQPTPALYFLNP